MRHRKMILLLDNATDVHQILPLLPATETTVVIITSRVTIASLSTYHPALTLVLDMLSAD